MHTRRKAKESEQKNKNERQTVRSRLNCYNLMKMIMLAMKFSGRCLVYFSSCHCDPFGTRSPTLLVSALTQRKKTPSETRNTQQIIANKKKHNNSFDESKSNKQKPLKQPTNLIYLPSRTLNWRPPSASRPTDSIQFRFNFNFCFIAFNGSRIKFCAIWEQFIIEWIALNFTLSWLGCWMHHF